MDEARGALVAATRDPEFWRCYAFDGHDNFDFETAGEWLARRLNGVNVDADDWCEEDDDDLVSAEVILPARRRGWWLSLSMSFELTLHVLCLNTDDDEDDDEDEDDEEYEDEEFEYEDDDRRVPYRSLELGHWDQARWRPFCLRWSELEAVVAQMRAEPDLHPLPPEVAMLLLARWVGHGSDEAALLNDRREVIAGTFEQLGLFRGEDAVRMAAQLLQAMPEDDYAWRWDSERGWLLSGEYAGYSSATTATAAFRSLSSPSSAGSWAWPTDPTASPERARRQPAFRSREEAWCAAGYVQLRSGMTGSGRSTASLTAPWPECRFGDGQAGRQQARSAAAEANPTARAIRICRDPCAGESQTVTPRARPMGCQCQASAGTRVSPISRDRTVLQARRIRATRHVASV